MSESRNQLWDASTLEAEFPANCTELRSFDESMRCGICKEIFSTPVTLKCGHGFCSQCIRSHLLYASQHQCDVCCPQCRQQCCDTDIRPDVTFSNAVIAYKTARSVILEEIRQTPSSQQKEVAICGSHQGAVVVDGDLPRSELKVPPVLHMNSVTAAQLKKRLSKLGVSTDGKKPELVSRYKKFRAFVQVEKDGGSRKCVEELALEFQKRNTVKRSASPMRLDGFCEGKTHQELIREARERSVNRIADHR